MTTRSRWKLDPWTLYDALDGQRRGRGLRWKDVAGQTGVGASTLSRLAAGRVPDADGLVSLLCWLGHPLAPYATGRTP